jgi:iron complex outermembrane receptor protein
MDRRKAWLLANAALAALVGGPAMAQTPPGQPDAQASGEGPLSGEVVTVTAQKRREALKDVPLAVTAISGETVENKGYTRLEDFAFAVPNVQFDQATDQRNIRLAIRGISSDTRFPGFESAVGVVVDGVYYAGAGGLNGDLFDVAQIEILRGPQGTLYGRNTSAGVVNIVTRQPGEERHIRALGELTAEDGELDGYRAFASVSGAIDAESGIFGSLAIARTEGDGYEINAPTGQELNGPDSVDLRGILRYRPDERFDVRLAFDYSWSDRTPIYVESAPLDYRTDVDFVGFNKRLTYGVSLSADAGLGDGLTLTSISAYRSYKTSEFGDQDLTTAPLGRRGNVESSEQVSQELRLTSPSGGTFEWVAGAFYLHEDYAAHGLYPIDIEAYYDLLFRPAFGGISLRTFYASLMLDGLVCDAPAPSCLKTQTADNLWTLETSSLAAFGQLKYNVTDRLALTVGARISSDEKDFTLDQDVFVGLPFIGVNFIVPVAFEGSQDETNFSPKLALSYDVTDDVTGYLSASWGYKSGGFFSNIIGNPAILPFLEFEPEESINYEAGLKGALFDGRAAFALAAFYIDYENLQVQRNFIDPLTNLPLTGIGNAAESTSWGIELEASVRLDDAFTLDGSAGYLDAAFDDYEACSFNPSTGAVLDCDGNRLAYAPDWTASLGLTMEQPISGDMLLVGNVEWTYRGDSYFSVLNEDTSFQEGFSLFNAYLGVATADGRYRAVLWARNLTDEYYSLFSTATLTGSGAVPGPPFTFGIRLSADL